MPDRAISETRQVKLREEYVELNKLLKFENLVGSGGEAKQAIAAGMVKVDGAVETRVRRKLVAGDRVEFAGVALEILAP